MTGLKIAIMGTRGIPASYGGFETFAEELATRLVSRGHEVTVYCRRPLFKKADGEKSYKGVRLVYTPTVMQKYLETPLHSLSSFCHSITQSYDVVLLCNAANSPFAFLNCIKRFPLAINVDGIERKRSKWNNLGKLWYRLGEYTSVLFGNRVIADADVIADYYRDRYALSPEVIAYGADEHIVEPGAMHKRYGLTPGKYILYVSRLEPENNALGVIQAYKKANVKLPLVIVGDAPYAKEYKKKLVDTAVGGVIFTGFRFGNDYRELRSHCHHYIQATEVGGTHPALLEAMAHGNCILANDVPEHREVLAEAGLYYRKNDFIMLSRLIREMAVNDGLRIALTQATRERLETGGYRWKDITDAYEALFYDMTAKVWSKPVEQESETPEEEAVAVAHVANL